MAYGQFTRRAQNRSANIRTSSVGGNRGNRNDKPKKKAKTLFGLTIGTPPKSDYQKKVDSGKATVFKTGAGGKITTTSTGKIMSVADQKKLKTDYTSASANYAKAKPAIGKAIQKNVPRTGIKPPSVLEKEKGSAKASVQATSKGAIKGRSMASRVKAKPAYSHKPQEGGTINKNDKVSLPKPKPVKPVIPEIPKSKPTLLRKDKNKRLFGGIQGGDKTPFKFLQNQTISPSASAKSIDNLLGKANLGMGQTLSPSKSFKSIMSLLGVQSGASGNKRGAFAKDVKKPSLVLSKSNKNLISKQASPSIVSSNIASAQKDMKKVVPMKKTKSDSKPIIPSLFNWWSSAGQKAMEEQKKKRAATLNQLGLSSGRPQY